jgi:uncharacterized protein (TIGR02268 family)
MRSPCSALLLVPVLLAGATAARAQPPTCQAGAPHIQLSQAAGAPVELCIRPGRFTTFLFDAPLATGAVVLEGRAHFREVEASGRALLLVPAEKLPPGARFLLEVRFAEGQVPERAQFILVAHPEQAAQQVEVSGAKPSESAALQEVERLQAELEQCRAQPPASSSAPASAPLFLAPALARGKLDENGLTVYPFREKDFSQRPGGELQVRRFAFYRTRSVLALQVRLKNEDAQKPWALEGAALLGPNGEVLQAAALYPREPLAPGATELRWVEWELPPPGATKSYTLQLWEAGKARIATVPGLKLP